MVLLVDHQSHNVFLHIGKVLFTLRRGRGTQSLVVLGRVSCVRIGPLSLVEVLKAVKGVNRSISTTHSNLDNRGREEGEVARVTLQELRP